MSEDAEKSSSPEYSQRTPDSLSTSWHLLSIDPGRDKCGLAVTDEKGVLLWRQVTPRGELMEVAADVIKRWNVSQIVVGDSTASAEVCANIQTRWPHLSLNVTDETGSTLEARNLYWEYNPPRGWRRFTPLSLQVPPEPIDDFAALVLAHRFLNKK